MNIVRSADAGPSPQGWPLGLVFHVSGHWQELRHLMAQVALRIKLQLLEWGSWAQPVASVSRNPY